MKKVILFQTPNKFYEVAPIFCKEADKFGIFDHYYIVTDYDGPDNMPNDRCEVIRLNKDHRFSGNIRRVLDKVKEDIFLVCCEDHIMLKPNDPELFEKCFRFVKNNSDVGFLRLTYNRSVPLLNKSQLFSRLDKKYAYYISLQPAIWRKEYLLPLLKDGETAWDFELKGAKRAKHDNKFHSYGVNENIFNHTNFFKKGKYYRRQYIDYALKEGIELDRNRKVYHGKQAITFEEYLKIHKSG